MSKAALITGGGIRLGRAISLALAERGYDIALHYNSSEKGAEETAREIKSLGVRCETFQADLSVIKKARALIPRVFEVFPECAVLINNASTFENINFTEVTEETFDMDLNINFKAPFFLTQDFSRQSAAELVVNMLDMRVSQIETEHFVYNLSKKALRDFTLMAAKALGPGIRVNGICPGPILPPPEEDEEYLARISKGTPLGKPGNPDYIILALKYILDNPYITGEYLFVDGGQHLT